MRVRISVPTLVALAILIFSLATLTYAQSASETLRLRPVQQDGKWGYIDNSGKLVIKPQFSMAGKVLLLRSSRFEEPCYRCSVN